MLSQLCLKTSSKRLIYTTTTSTKRLEVVVARPAGHNYYTCLAIKATTSQIIIVKDLNRYYYHS